MIQNKATPDDRDYREYFLKLREMRYNNSNFFFVNRMSRSLAISQRHLCPICEENLYNGETLHKHHIIPFKECGKTNFTNLVLLHLPCHNVISFKKDKQEILEIQNNLIEYKQKHPNLLLRFLSKKRKEGLQIPQINENLFNEFETDLEAFDNLEPPHCYTEDRW